MSVFSNDQRQLMELMWKVSEEAWSVGWMEGMEFDVWKFMQEGPGRYGQLILDEPILDRLRELATKAGGWIYWDKVEQETWIDMPAWKEMYSARVSMPGKSG